MHFGTVRLGIVAEVMASASVTGSETIRHAVYTADGIRVGRHCSVAPTSLIPQAYVDRVVAPTPEGLDATPTLTGVTFEGQNKPAVVSLSRVCKPRRHGAVAAPAAPVPDPSDSLPCRVVFSAAGGGMELLHCTACDRLFTTVHRYSGHACEGVVVSTGVCTGCGARPVLCTPTHRCIDCGG